MTAPGRAGRTLAFHSCNMLHARYIGFLIGSEFPQSTWLQPFALPHSDPLRRVWEGSLRPSDIMASAYICLRKGPIRNRAYLSIGVTSSSGAGLCGASGGAILGVSGWGMQDLGYELPRTPIPRTRVNKARDRSVVLLPEGWLPLNDYGWQ